MPKKKKRGIRPNLIEIIIHVLATLQIPIASMTNLYIFTEQAEHCVLIRFFVFLNLIVMCFACIVKLIYQYHLLCRGY